MTAYRAPGEVLDDLPQPIAVETVVVSEELAPLIGRPRTDVVHEDDDLSVPRFVAALAYMGMMAAGLAAVGRPVTALLFVPVLVMGGHALLQRLRGQT